MALASSSLAAAAFCPTRAKLHDPDTDRLPLSRERLLWVFMEKVADPECTSETSSEARLRQHLMAIGLALSSWCWHRDWSQSHKRPFGLQWVRGSPTKAPEITRARTTSSPCRRPTLLLEFSVLSCGFPSRLSAAALPLWR